MKKVAQGTCRSIKRMFSLHSVIALACFFFVLTSCSSGNFAGGTSTETTNGIVILTSSGMPASGARISVVDGSHWIDSIVHHRSPVLEKSITNESGHVWVKQTTGTRTVRVEFGDQSAIISGDCDTIVLTKSMTLKGTAFGTDSVRIGGTDLVVPVKNDGSFRIESVPEGYLTLFRETVFGIENGITVSTEDTTVTHDLIQNGSGLLFENFSGGFDLNPISPISGGVHWYTFCDSIHKSYHQGFWKVDSLSSHNGNSLISANAENGVARQEILLGSGTTYPYAGLGAELGNSGRGFNLTDLSAVTVRIRGNGTVRIRLSSALLDSLNISGYSAKIAVDSNWNTVRIPLDSFHLDTKDSTAEQLYPWTSGVSNIRRIELFSRGTENVINSEIWFEIDEIKWEGVDFPL